MRNRTYLKHGAEDRLVVGAKNCFQTTLKDLGWQDVRHYMGDVIDCEWSDVLCEKSGQ